MYQDDSKKAFGMDWSDTRPLAEMRFAIEDPVEVRAEYEERVRRILAIAGVKVADDITALGCTGLIDHVPLSDCAFVREHIAGSGTGLPCFVPPTRFCLVHNVIGGLQEKQRPLFPANVERVSRSLTDAEAARVVAMEELRRTKGADVVERMRNTAERLNNGDESIVESFQGTPEPEMPTAAATAHMKVFPVNNGVVRLCGEHSTTNWRCRECVAQEVLNGAYEPPLLIAVAEEDGHATPENIDRIAGSDVVAKIEDLNARDARAVALYVRAARWSRRLARE